MQTGIPVEKNRLEGKPITVSILLSFSSLVRIRSSAPLRNNTPCGSMIAIVPPLDRKWKPCNKNAKSAADLGAMP